MDKHKYGGGDGHDDYATTMLQRSAMRSDKKTTTGIAQRSCPYAEGATSSSLHSSVLDLEEDEADLPNQDEVGSDASNSGK